MSTVITGLDEQTAARFARMVLENVAREYPNHITHMLNGDTDAMAPRKLHPTFYGSYDWHSSVHSHWLLVRILRLFPLAGVAPEIRSLLERHLTSEKLAAERAYFEQPHRATFERPYGLAWLLQLAAELHEWRAAEAMHWHAVLASLEELAKARFAEWLPKLTHPVRSGEHSQTAFALGMTLDCARITGDRQLASLVESRSRDFYLPDINAPLAYEPCGHDFLSPALAEADLMRRVLPQKDFVIWLTRFMPQIPVDDTDWLRPVVSRDQSDGKLAHLDGLNLSRAWMCESIAGALPENDARRDAMLATAAAHTKAGLAAISERLYAGSHWLPSFAVYLLTRRGMK
ncbi:MAG TPA: DUF2891 domain-containing protein [Gammaproteobacteria bacterium]|nr:DUF2891 domain-containing protein [Gammaproteobacteria bacterium]